MSLADRLYYWRAYRLERRALWENVPPDREILERVLEGRDPGRALDLGTGTGRNAIYLAKRGWRVVGLDVHPVAIARAQRAARDAGIAADAEFLRQNALDLEPLGTFDLILDVLGPMSDLLPSLRPRYAERLRDALNPGGIYLLHAPLEGRALQDLDRLLARRPLAAGHRGVARWSAYARMERLT